LKGEGKRGKVSMDAGSPTVNGGGGGTYFRKGGGGGAHSYRKEICRGREGGKLVYCWSKKKTIVGRKEGKEKGGSQGVPIDSRRGGALIKGGESFVIISRRNN